MVFQVTTLRSHEVVTGLSVFAGLVTGLSVFDLAGQAVTKGQGPGNFPGY